MDSQRVIALPAVLGLLIEADSHVNTARHRHTLLQQEARCATHGSEYQFDNLGK